MALNASALDPDLRALADARLKAKRAREAMEQFRSVSQSETDRIVRAMTTAGGNAARELARLAADETGHGVYEDKVRKNRFCTTIVGDSIAPMRTRGVLWADDESRTTAIGAPMGVVAGIVPVTNPTSTVLYKALIAVKAGNAIVFAPHPRGAGCSARSAQVMAEAAEAAGAPTGLISCLSTPTLEATNDLMRSRDVSLILATGGADMVRAAYSSGKPTIAVGPGNCPAYIDRSVADVVDAAEGIVASKSFDNGTACVAEQAVVVHDAIHRDFEEALGRAGLAWVPPGYEDRLAAVLFTESGRIRPEGVGRPAVELAERAGFDVPSSTRVLGVKLTDVSREILLSHEKLAPVLAVYRVADSDHGWELCNRILDLGGLGHTMSVYAEDPTVVTRFSDVPTGRILINTPTLFGGMGYSANVGESFMLGTGTWGGSITSDNVTPLHLINIKRLAYETRPWRTVFDL